MEPEVFSLAFFFLGKTRLSLEFYIEKQDFWALPTVCPSCDTRLAILKWLVTVLSTNIGSLARVADCRLRLMPLR